jgi:chromosome partitioning protein
VRVAVVNLKGGTAKSTSSMFLAAALSRRGRTMLVDTDPQGSALTWAEAAEADGDELGYNVVSIPTRDVKKRVDRMAGDYAHVVIDTPPGELDIVRAALHAAEVAVVAISPSVMDINRFRPTLELIAEVESVKELDYRVLLTMVRRISREGRDARQVMEELELPVLAAEIPHLSLYRSAFGATIEDLGDYDEVASELLGEAGSGARA